MALWAKSSWCFCSDDDSILVLDFVVDGACEASSADDSLMPLSSTPTEEAPRQTGKPSTTARAGRTDIVDKQGADMFCSLRVDDGRGAK